MSQQLPPKYNIDQLTQYLQLMTLYSGEAPKEVSITQEAFNWFREQQKRAAKYWGLPHEGIKDESIAFLGVKLKPIVKLEK